MGGGGWEREDQQFTSYILEGGRGRVGEAMTGLGTNSDNYVWSHLKFICCIPGDNIVDT